MRIFVAKLSIRTMKTTLMTIVCMLAMFGCTSKQEAEYRLVDEKTFYINGVDARDGYEAVAQSLIADGFSLRDSIVPGTTYSPCSTATYRREAVYEVNDGKAVVEPENIYYGFDKLTGGLFQGIPSALKEAREGNAMFISYYDIDVSIDYYRSGVIEAVRIWVNGAEHMDKNDALEINRRLSELMPHSELGNKTWGYMTYYDDNGIEVYYTNKFDLVIKKR